MIDELCHELKNWFDENPKDGTKNHYFGTYVISDRTLDLSEIGIQTGQYFRIVGSVFNDGVYEYPTSELVDETFSGAVWAMAVPPEVIALDAEIDAWKDKYQSLDSPAMSPYNSESFGGYSYTKGGSTSGNSALGGTWQGAFSSRLNKWRKIR